MKTKNLNKGFRFLFLLSLMFYSIIFFTVRFGYYDQQLKNRQILTKEKMEAFERDVANGLNVELIDYVEDTNKYFTNKIGLGYKVSDAIGKISKKSLNQMFKILYKLVEN